MVRATRLKVAMDNMRNLYPSASGEELSALARRMCLHWGRFIIQAGRLKSLTREDADKLIRFEGLENLKEAFALKKGVILATAHFGWFETANGALALEGYPVWSVIRTVDNKDIDWLTDDCRTSTGLGVIKKENAATEIIKHLRSGGMVTIAVDQNAGFNNIFTPFLGKLAATIVAPAVASLRTGAPVLPMFSIWDGRENILKVKIHPAVKLHPTGSMSANIRLVTMKINEALEEAVKAAPEQWLWIHKRWKTAPEEKDLAAIEADLKIINATTGASAPAK